MDRTEKVTMLIVDDQLEVLEVYRDVLQDYLKHDVECVCMPGEGLHLVRKQLFDMVVIDAKIPYKQSSWGGLLLAEEVSRILGSESVLLISQYNVRDQISHFNSSIRFLPKPEEGQSLIIWAEKMLMEKIKSMIRQQYGFVVMPYDRPDCDAWYLNTLTPWMSSAGYALKRMDEIATTRAINIEMLNRIREAHFVVVYAPFENPNVYFEAGFAVALEKFLLLFAMNLEDLPFDIKANRVFTVEGPEDPDKRQEVANFMQSLRGVC